MFTSFYSFESANLCLLSFPPQNFQFPHLYLSLNSISSSAPYYSAIVCTLCYSSSAIFSRFFVIALFFFLFHFHFLFPTFWSVLYYTYMNCTIYGGSLSPLYFYIFYRWQIDFATFTQTIIIYGINPYLSMSCKWSLLFEQNHLKKSLTQTFYSVFLYNLLRNENRKSINAKCAISFPTLHPKYIYLNCAAFAFAYIRIKVQVWLSVYPLFFLPCNICFECKTVAHFITSNQHHSSFFLALCYRCRKFWNATLNFRSSFCPFKIFISFTFLFHLCVFVRLFVLF